MASGFSFLRTQFPGLEKTGEFAERYLYSDSNSCLFKLGLLCEDIVNKMFDFDNIAMPYQMKDTLVNKQSERSERAGAFAAGAGGKLKLNKNQDLGSGKS